MISRFLFPALTLLAMAAPAVAQESGGLALAANVGKGPVGLARALPFTPTPLITAQDFHNAAMPASRSAQNQDMITRLRGDPGFLGGFAFGSPLAASRQVATGQDGFGFDGGPGRHRHHGGRPIIINNEGPLAVTVGNGNVVQQQSASGPGPIAQQQIANTSGAGQGGALNLVTGGGNIVQRAPR